MSLGGTEAVLESCAHGTAMTRVVAHHVQQAGAHLLCNLSDFFSCAVPHLEAEGDADGVEAQQAHAPRHIHHICARAHKP